jgi:hypothetical protein
MLNTMWSFVKALNGFICHFEMESNTPTRMNKGIFFPNEDAQLCHSLHVSQDHIANNGKKKTFIMRLYH